MHFCSFTVSRLSLRIWHVWICNHRNCQRSRVLGHWTRLLLLFPEVGTPATCVPCATQRFVHIGWLFFRKRNCSYVCLNGGGHAQLGFQWKRWPSYTQKSLKRVLRIPGWYEATEREKERKEICLPGFCKSVGKMLGLCIHQMETQLTGRRGALGPYGGLHSAWNLGREKAGSGDVFFG